MSRLALRSLSPLTANNKRRLSIFPSGNAESRLQTGKEVKVSLIKILYTFRVILHWVVIVVAICEWAAEF